MNILGIETSADDTAVAILETKGGFRKPRFSVLANTSFSQIPIHKKWGGIVPNLASRAHLEKITPVTKQAFKIAKTKPQKIDLIAVTQGPGLQPSLLIGINFARGLAYQIKKPIIGVNHLEGHIYSNWLSNKKIEFPALILIVSGGHTELILMKDYGKYELLGQTRDDAAGETFDKTARILGFDYPGGPMLAKLAQNGNPEAFPLPRPMINSKNYDFSFSGLKTAVLYEFQKNSKIIKKNLPDFAASIQQAIIDVLVTKTLKAAKNYKPKSVMLAGGVAANKKLREVLGRALEINFPEEKYFVPKMPFTTDNAAMIAAAGYFNFLKSASRRTKQNTWQNLKAQSNLKLA